MKGIAIQRILAVLFPMILVAVVVILSWVGFILFSYFQTTETLKAKTYHLWAEQQAEVTEAWQQFQHYQNLMEFRLLNSLGRKEAILRILDARVEHVINKHFPMIMGLTFVSSLEPTVKYTRFGKQDLDSQKEEIKVGVQYLGQGLFKINKLLHNTKQKAFGTLQSTISIKHLLSLHFPESEISIFAEQMGNVPTKLITESAQKGFPRAQFQLGQQYRMGKGVNKDRNEAIRWYTLAKNSGFQKATQELEAMKNNEVEEEIVTNTAIEEIKENENN